MSLLDIDEAILAIAKRVDVVYGPLVDAQEFPKAVDVTLIEGAVSSQDDLEKVHTIRQRSKLVVALGDCAVTGNVPAMRNRVPVKKLLQRIYVDGTHTGRRRAHRQCPRAVEARRAGPRGREGGRSRTGLPAAAGDDLLRHR